MYWKASSYSWNAHSKHRDFIIQFIETSTKSGWTARILEFSDIEIQTRIKEGTSDSHERKTERIGISRKTKETRTSVKYTWHLISREKPWRQDLESRLDLLQKGIEQEQEEWIRLKQGLIP